MKPLTIERFGDEVQGIRLRGDPRVRPEPVHVRIAFPGGDVDIARCDDGSYWVHVRVDSEADVKAEAADHAGRILDARLDIRGRHASECNAGDFAHPDLYHLAVRVAPVARPDCPDHWHCDPQRAPHLCDKPDRSKECPSCGGRPDKRAR